MKRNALALGVAAALGMVGAAQAQLVPAAPAAGVAATAFDFNPQGVGHVLIAPYYTAAGGNFTNINLVNTDTVNGKLLKVRFRSAANSDDVFDFQLFMSPSDMWSAAIAEDAATGLATLLTKDTSCTLPAGVKGGTANKFVTDRINAVGLADGDLQAWTREGYVEVLNMADIPGPNAPAAIKSVTYDVDTDESGKSGQLFKTVKHVSGVAPCDYAGVLNVENYGREFGSIAEAGQNGLYFPSGKLFGNSTIVNGQQTQVFSAELAAIVATANATDGRNTSDYGNFSFFPQLNSAPSTAVDTLTSDPLLRTLNVSPVLAGATLPLIAPRSFDFPDLSTPYLASQATGTTGPITTAAALMKAVATASVSNEFFNNPSYGGKTDWVFSMPLRRYQVAMDYKRADRTAQNAGYDGRVFTLSPIATEQYFDSTNTGLDAAGGSKICVNTGGVTQYDREEGVVTGGFVISPGTATSVRFCGEVSVVSIGGTAIPQTPVLGSRVAGVSISSNYKEGWMRISTPGLSGRGLPIMGKAFMSARNGAAAQGVAANYGLSFAHRYSKP